MVCYQHCFHAVSLAQLQHIYVYHLKSCKPLQFLSRLGFCYDDLTKRLGQNIEEDGNIQCQAGAVCGSLGDCSRRLGDTASAIDYYERSTSHLKAAPANSEVWQMGSLCSEFH